MSDFVIAPEVSRGLADIWRHIAQDDPDAADRVLDGIQAAFGNLADLPGMGHRRTDLSEACGFGPCSAT